MNFGLRTKVQTKLAFETLILCLFLYCSWNFEVIELSSLLKLIIMDIQAQKEIIIEQFKQVNDVKKQICVH